MLLNSARALFYRHIASIFRWPSADIMHAARQTSPRHTHSLIYRANLPS